MSIASMSDVVLATVQRPTLSTDGFNTRTYATHLSNVPVKVDEISGDSARRYEREGQRLTHTIFTKGSPDIKAKDRITFTDSLDDGTSVSRTLEIVAVLRQSRPNGTPHHTKMFAFEETRV